jgi:hypothetical protein
LNQIVADFVSCQNQINSFFVNHRLPMLLKQSNIAKKSGVSAVVVMRYIFSLIFTGKNLFRSLQAAESNAEFYKDTAYRFLNSVTANWRKLLHLLSAAIINKELVPLTSEKTVKVFIADDSLYNRDRSKKVELLARVHDHNENRYYRGFRMLTLGWSDGISQIPVSFALLSSAKEKNRLVPMQEGIDKRTNGYRRRLESMSKAPQALADLVRGALKSGIQADYILFDSWFSFPSTIMAMRTTKVHVVCMLKDLKTIRYGYQGNSLRLAELFKVVRKKAGRAKILAQVVVEIGKDDKGMPVQAKIVFVRDRSSKNWLALLSTDVTLTEEEIISLYKRRWDIEVFFKMTKSFLNLAKEFQSRSYDALVAHTTIVFCRYIMLALARRMNKDPRTLGTLFHAGCDELRQATFTEALQQMLAILQDIARDFLGLTVAQIDGLLQKFINEITPLFRRYLLLPERKLADC